MRICKNGEGYAKLFETSVLSVSVHYRIVWTKDRIDLAELASKRWGEKWSLAQITKHFGYGRTAVVRKIGQIKKNPELILDGRIRSMIKSRKYRIMGNVKGSDD